MSGELEIHAAIFKLVDMRWRMEQKQIGSACKILFKRMKHSNHVLVFSTSWITDPGDFQAIDIHYLVLKNLHPGILKGCESLIFAQEVFMVAGYEKDAFLRGKVVERLHQLL